MDHTTYELLGTHEQGVEVYHLTCGRSIEVEWDYGKAFTLSHVLTAATKHTAVCSKIERP